MYDCSYLSRDHRRMMGEVPVIICPNINSIFLILAEIGLIGSLTYIAKAKYLKTRFYKNPRKYLNLVSCQIIETIRT